MKAIVLLSRILFVVFVVPHSMQAEEDIGERKVNVSDKISADVMQSNRNLTNSNFNGCGAHAYYTFEDGIYICECIPGFEDNFGTCEECDCGEGLCAFVLGIKNCACKMDTIQVNGKCQECDCGDGECKFVGGIKKCTCENNQIEVNGKCMECDCGDGECKFVGGIKKCTCENNQIEVNGKCLGKPVIGCGTNGFYSMENGVYVCKCYSGFEDNGGTCEECDCGEGGSCEFVFGEKKCNCGPILIEINGKCEDPLCDCGEYGDCNFEYGVPVCRCHYGYKDNDGTCEECDCGDGECEFVGGIKKCTCKNHLIEANGKCQECDCGENSISCTLSWMKLKRCTCKDGYEVSSSSIILDDKCIKCECGTNGISCSFRTEIFLEKQTCTCKYGGTTKTEREGQRCKECDCGPNSYQCYFNSMGYRRCECQENYVSEKEDGYSWSDEYCKSKETTGSRISGWRIATYVLSIFMAIIIIALLIGIVNKNTR